jgi:hypothetical protein
MAKSYISMKSLSESLVSLDIPPTNAKLKLNFIHYVTRQENGIGLVGFAQPRISLSGPVHQRDFLLDQPVCSASAKGTLRHASAVKLILWRKLVGFVLEGMANEP